MSSTKRGTIRMVNDHYNTPAYTTRSLLLHHTIEYPVLEPCAGNLAIANMLKTDMVYTNDINPASPSATCLDYLQFNENWYDLYQTIITNPPFNIALDIIKKAMNDVVDEGEVIMLLRLNFLGSQKRHDFWQEYPPKTIYVLSKRPKFINGKSDSIEYAWFVWQKGYNGNTKLEVI